jgi:hypothetical protein
MDLVEKLRVKEHIDARIAKVKVVSAVVDDVAFTSVAVAESIHTFKGKIVD